MNIIFYIALSLTIFCCVGLIFAPVVLRPSPEARRLLDVVQSDRPDKRTVSSKEVARDKLLSIARSFRARLGLSEDEKLRQRFISAGMKGNNKLDLYFTARFLGPLLGIIGGSFVQKNTTFWCMACAGAGYLLPDIWLSRQVR